MYFSCAAGLLFLGASLGSFMAPVEMPLIDGSVQAARQVALGVWKGWVVAPLLYFWVLTQGIKTEAQTKQLLLNFVFSAALISLASFGFALWSEGWAVDGRLIGFFESANYLSLYLVPALLLSLYFVFQKNFFSTPFTWLNRLAVLLIAIALFLTQSYAAILAVFAAMGFFVLRLLILHRKRTTWVWGAFAALSILFAGVMVSQWNTPKFQQFLDWENRSSTSVRLEIYQTSLHLIAQQPWVGVGPGLFQAHYQNAAPQVLGHAPLEWNMPHPHNIFLGFWLNAGLLGFLALLGFIGLAHQRFTYPLIALWGLLVHGLFDMPFWKNDLAMVFWLVFAMILTLQVLEQEDKIKTLP